MAIFQVDLRKPVPECLHFGFYQSRGWRRWWWQLDYWSYKLCKAWVKSSPPTNQHPVFFSPNQQC